MAKLPSDPADHSAGRNTLRNIGLISGREYKSQITQRSYKVTTIIYLVIITVGAFVPTIIQYIQAHTNSQAQTKIAIIDNARGVANMNGAVLTHYIETNLNRQANQASSQSTAKNAHFVVSTETANDLKKTQSDVKNGNLNILLVIDRQANQDVSFTYYTTSSDPTDSDLAQVRNMTGQLSILDRGARQNLSPAQISSLFAQPQFTITNLQEGQNGRSVANIVTGIILAYVGVILINIAILTYGNGVALGVAEEKGGHIMEILVIAATPFQLMAGKIIGIGAAGLTQMASLVLVGVSMLAIQNPIKAALLGNTAGSLNINITGASVTMLLLILLYFILGFALYASLFAAVGALVRRQEEARTAGTPIILLFMVGYLISVSIASIPGAPNATWVTVMSYIPFWSPTLMLLRIGVGAAAWWEVLMTVALMAVTIPACTWLSARIYRAGVLMYGQRFKLGQLLKATQAA